MLELKIEKDDTKSPMALMSELVKSSSPATSTPGSSPSSKGSKEELFSDSMKEISKINVKEGEEDDNDEDDIEMRRSGRWRSPREEEEDGGSLKLKGR